MTAHMALMPMILSVCAYNDSHINSITLCTVGHFGYIYLQSLLILFALWYYSSTASTISICSLQDLVSSRENKPLLSGLIFPIMTGILTYYVGYSHAMHIRFALIVKSKPSVSLNCNWCSLKCYAPL